MTDESPAKFTATDPLTQNTIKVDHHGHDFHTYIYEYGASSPVIMNQETVRAIMNEGARRERENPTPREQTKEERLNWLRSQEGTLIAMLRDLPEDSLIERCGLTARLYNVRVEIESLQGKPAKALYRDDINGAGFGEFRD